LTKDLSGANQNQEEKEGGARTGYKGGNGKLKGGRKRKKNRLGKNKIQGVGEPLKKVKRNLLESN